MRLSTFDLSACAVAGVAFACNWSRPEAGLSGSFFRGVQSFAVVSIFDKVLCEEEAPFKVKVPSVAEWIASEALFLGLFQTKSRAWSLLRLGGGFMAGTYMALTVTGMNQETMVSDDPKIPSILAIGILWAVFRELLVWNLPVSISFQTLSLLDSLFYAIISTGPAYTAVKKDLAILQCPNPILLTKDWCYRALTEFFFRYASNEIMRTHGLVALITQSLFFSCLGALAPAKE